MHAGSIPARASTFLNGQSSWSRERGPGDDGESGICRIAIDRRQTARHSGVEASFHSAALRLDFGFGTAQHFHFGRRQKIVNNPAEMIAHGFSGLGGIARA